jgi:hypothetical protein
MSITGISDSCFLVKYVRESLMVLDICIVAVAGKEGEALEDTGDEVTLHLGAVMLVVSRLLRLRRSLSLSLSLSHTHTKVSLTMAGDPPWQEVFVVRSGRAVAGHGQALMIARHERK